MSDDEERLERYLNANFEKLSQRIDSLEAKIRRAHLASEATRSKQIALLRKQIATWIERAARKRKETAE